MRYPASEKLEIIRLVERSHLSARRTLANLGIAKTTFYRWYDRYLAFGETGLDDRTSGPGRVWNRIPDDVRGEIVDLALEEPELSPRELAVRFTDTKGYFVSEASVYRILKAHDLITSPAFVVIKAADEFRDKTTAPNQFWQTDFHLPQGHRLGLVLSVDHSRRLFPIHHRLEALHHHEGGRCDENAQVGVGSIRMRRRQCRPQTEAAQRQWFILYLRRSGRLARKPGHGPRPGRTIPPANPGQDRALAPNT